MKHYLFYFCFPTKCSELKKLDCSCLNERDRKYSFKVTLSRAHVIVFAVKPHYVIHMLIVCSLLFSIHRACSVLYCRLWHGWFRLIFQHYLVNGTTFGKALLYITYIFWIFCANFSDKFIEHDTVIDVHRSLLKVPFILFRF